MGRSVDIRIASRKSDLARLQAYQVGNLLLKNGHKVNYHFRESLGDINQDDPLWKMPEKGVFTEDFREGLIQGQWDVVVHSWKDLPIDIEEGTQLVATLPRADVRDLIIIKKKHLDKIKTQNKLKVYSSSPRRIYNLSEFLKISIPGKINEVEFTSVRGNILTRVKKLFEDDSVDGLVVAKAAFDRLLSVKGEEFNDGKEQLKKYFSQCYWQVLPIVANPTAAAQGALAVEVAKHRKDLIDLFADLNCQSTWKEVVEERQILKSYGGGCHQKIGVNCLTRGYGSITILRGEAESGETLRSFEQSQLKIKLSKPLKKWPSIFNRKKINVEAPDVNAHFVAKCMALPESVDTTDQLLWCSGVETWKKLAESGRWVNGCAESLGEQEDPKIENLFEKPRWAKWTHEQGYVDKDKKLMASYQLSVSDVPNEVLGYEEYYWKSGSQFIAVTKRFPEILKAKHFCGPGNTFTMISEVLEKQNINIKPVILASPQIWQKLCEE